MPRVFNVKRSLCIYEHFFSVKFKCWISFEFSFFKCCKNWNNNYTTATYTDLTIHINIFLIWTDWLSKRVFDIFPTCLVLRHSTFYIRCKSCLKFISIILYYLIFSPIEREMKIPLTWIYFSSRSLWSVSIIKMSRCN